MKTTIAILDPHELIRKALAGILTTFGYEVIIEVKDEEELIGQILSGNIPDICIIDVNVYDMKGIKTAKKIRAEFPPIKIVIYSNDLHKQVYHKIKNPQVGDHYVDKKSGVDILKRVLELCSRQLICIGTPKKENST